jgi:threonine-phosphate decarboxylase
MINRAHGGNVWPYFSNSKITDFSASINPLSLPSTVKGIIERNIDKLSHYPDPESKGLKIALAKSYNLSTANLLIGNGSIELIYLILQALKPSEVLIPQPTFSEYEFASRINGARVFFLRTKESEAFRIDLSRFKKLIPRSGLVFLCNPNNPTGALLPDFEVLSLLNLCRKHKAILVVDEVFMDFVPAAKKQALISEAVKDKNLLVLKSLTKFFALAGLRLGYLIGHTKLIDSISAFRYPWNVNSLAQMAGEEALKDKKYIKQTGEFMPKERAYLFDNLSRIEGLKVFPAAANFFLCKLESARIKDARNLSKKLLEYGILIRDCYNFRGLNNKFFRVAVRLRKENNRLIIALKGII